MSQNITAGDIWRVYVKPSLDGKIIFRKRNTVQTSARVKASKERIAAAKPGHAAKEACEKAKRTVTKRVYVPGKGYQEVAVCPISEFRKFLKEETEKAHGVKK